MRDILRDTLDACEARERLLIYPTMEGLWEHGTGHKDGLKVRKTVDDLTWWFVEAFCDPKEAAIVKRILDAVPGFFFERGGQVDWQMVNELRSWLKRAAWPTAYDVATKSTKSEASVKAASLIGRLTTAEGWRQK